MTGALATDRVPAPLLDHLLDHAALFPPANLSMADALQVDRAARRGPYAALVGVFVCLASRLEELTAELAAQRADGAGNPGDPAEQLPISVVVDAAGVPRPTDAHVDLRLLELRMPAALALAALDEAPPGLPAYVEVPIEDLERELDVLAQARAGGTPVGGKVRCGGRRVPSDDELAAVLQGCAERGLPLKATQGLHSAIRTDSQHGFLNLLIACAAALRVGDVKAALAEQSTEAVLAALPDAALAREVRNNLLVSYGTCSLSEPVDELRALGLLQ
jgi:hypothetical protein